MADIRVEGADRVLGGLARMRDATEAQRTVVRALGDRYLHVLQDETPVGRGEHPGALRAGYDTEDQAYAPTEAHYRIVNQVPHLRYVLSGRGAVHAISARALRFVIDGQVIFRRSVGPAEANDFPPRARARMQRDIDEAGARIAGLIVRSYRGGRS